MYTELREKIKLQRLHLATTRNLLSKQFDLKNEINSFVRHSEQQLEQMLNLEKSSVEKINHLTEKLRDDKCLRTDCRILILELRAEVTVTKKEIERSKLKLHQIKFPKKTAGFFRRKNDDSQSSSLSHQTVHLVHL
ncbi:hypothetical protein [Rickettsiella endosymbiont of Aleochara curtula]|uniref:hypothetical protein n=1 Tax=Rickettsiella endosymbiont of Aleochara curtula TaxID=3077936 RepID=UPI00313D5F61